MAAAAETTANTTAVTGTEAAALAVKIEKPGEHRVKQRDRSLVIKIMDWVGRHSTKPKGNCSLLAAAFIACWKDPGLLRDPPPFVDRDCKLRDITMLAKKITNEGLVTEIQLAVVAYAEERGSRGPDPGMKIVDSDDQKHLAAALGIEMVYLDGVPQDKEGEILLQREKNFRAYIREDELTELITGMKGEGEVSPGDCGLVYMPAWERNDGPNREGHTLAFVCTVDGEILFVDNTRDEADRVITDMVEERHVNYYGSLRLQTQPIFYCHCSGVHAHFDQEGGALLGLAAAEVSVKQEDDSEEEQSAGSAASGASHPADDAGDIMDQPTAEMEEEIAVDAGASNGKRKATEQPHGNPEKQPKLSAPTPPATSWFIPGVLSSSGLLALKNSAQQLDLSGLKDNFMENCRDEWGGLFFREKDLEGVNEMIDEFDIHEEATDWDDDQKIGEDYDGDNCFDELVWQYGSRKARGGSANRLLDEKDAEQVFFEIVDQEYRRLLVIKVIEHLANCKKASTQVVSLTESSSSSEPPPPCSKQVEQWATRCQPIILVDHFWHAHLEFEEYAQDCYDLTRELKTDMGTTEFELVIGHQEGYTTTFSPHSSRPESYESKIRAVYGSELIHEDRSLFQISDLKSHWAEAWDRKEWYEAAQCG